MKFKRLYEDEKMDIFPTREEKREIDKYKRFDQELRAFIKKNHKPEIKRDNNKKIYRNKVSLELISGHLNDPIGPELDSIHEDIYKITRMIRSAGEMARMIKDGVFEPYLAKIEKLVYDRFGISICITQSMSEPFACCIPFIINKENVLSTRQEREGKDIPIKDNARKFARANYLADGEIDLVHGKVSGVLSKYNHIVNMEYYSLFVEAKATIRETTACFLHEIGHLFTFIDMGYRTNTTNQIMNSICNSLKTKEPAAKRKYLLIDLAKNGMMDTKLVEKLAKEERPMILAAELFREIYKGYVNTSLSLYYTDTTSESLADDFATKFGYGKEIITFLDKLEHDADETRKFLGMAGLTIVFPILIAVTCFMSPMTVINTILGSIAVGSIWITRIYRWLFMHLTGRVDMTYDTLFQRVVRIKRTLIDILKDRGIPAHTRESTIAIIESLEAVIKKRDVMEQEDLDTDISNVLSVFVPGKTEEDNFTKIERLMERLANNNLFLASAKLETILDKRFGSNKSKSKLTALENYDGVNEWVESKYNNLMKNAKLALSKKLNPKTNSVTVKLDKGELTMIADRVKVNGKESVISVDDLIDLMVNKRYKKMIECVTKSLVNKLPSHYNKYIDEELNIAHMSEIEKNPPISRYLKTNAVLKNYFIDVFGFKEFYRNMDSMNTVLGGLGFEEIFKIPTTLRIDGTFTTKDIERLYKCADDMKQYLPSFYKEDNITYYLTKVDSIVTKELKAKVDDYVKSNPHNLTKEQLNNIKDYFLRYIKSNYYSFYSNLDIYLFSYIDILNRVFKIINMLK